MIKYVLAPVFAALLVAASGVSAFCNVRLPSILSSGMVLEQQSRVKIWGWSEPGEKIFITTSWNNVTDSTKGTRDGRWEMMVTTGSAGGPYVVTVRGWNTIKLDNVMLGEVWVCSGQSNMEMCGNWGLPDIKAELPSCATNNIHFFHIPRTTSDGPQDNCGGSWTPCDSIELKSFSAAGYFFGKRLNAELNVPIGLVEAAWGGTPAEVWTPAEQVENDPVLKQANARLKPADGWPYIPGRCYNGMIAPITPYSIAGAIWYQGEGNTAAPATYSRLFTTMITSWRKAWGKDLPFYYVQIAPFTYGAQPGGTLIREQQDLSMRLQNTGMVVVSDLVTDTTDIHPKDKHDVGYRLANWALSETYHKSGIVYRSPWYQSQEVNGDKMVLTIAGAPGGLVIKGAQAQALSIAGADKIWYPAEARVDGNHLTVWSKKVKNPVACRYQFSNAGIGNISSKDGLPLAPFRTDDWEMVMTSFEIR
jgi:sialate O-acetylesterase